PSQPETLSTPPSMHADGIPPIPAPLAQRVARYAQAPAIMLVGWHPQKREMLVVKRAGDSTQWYRIDHPGGRLRPLATPVNQSSSGTYRPGHGDYLVLADDRE